MKDVEGGAKSAELMWKGGSRGETTAEGILKNFHSSSFEYLLLKPPFFSFLLIHRLFNVLVHFPTLPGGINTHFRHARKLSGLGKVNFVGSEQLSPPIILSWWFELKNMYRALSCKKAKSGHATTAKVCYKAAVPFIYTHKCHPVTFCPPPPPPVLYQSPDIQHRRLMSPTCVRHSVEN